MKTSAMMRCPKCEETSELDNLHLLDHSFKREWVGLTKKEVHDLYDADYVVFHQRIEARLKEKNGA